MSEKVRVGVIGTSWWMDLMYVPSLNSHPGATVVAVCGRNADRAAEIAAKFGGARVFTDYRDMIGAGDLDAVVVAVPDDLHNEMTLAAIDAGLHVLCEKPLANTTADAIEMQRRAEAAGVKNMVLFTWRWQPHWRYVKHLVDTGYLGRCYLGRFTFSNGSAYDKGYKWRLDGRRANGIASDLGSHMIDLARWYLGDVVAVSADLPMFTDQSGEAEPSPTPANDACLMTLEMRSGARAEIDVSAVSFVADQIIRLGVELYGDAGTIEAEHIFLGVEAGLTLRGVRKGEPNFTPLAVPDEYFAGGVERDALLDPYVKQAAGARLFIDAIREDRPAVPDFSSGVRVQEVLDAAFRSHAERRWISVS